MKKLINKIPTTIKYVFVFIVGAIIGVLPWAISSSLFKSYHKDNKIDERVKNHIEDFIAGE